jgi:hypothetical protein
MDPFKTYQHFPHPLNTPLNMLTPLDAPLLAVINAGPKLDDVNVNDVSSVYHKERPPGKNLEMPGSSSMRHMGTFYHCEG